MKKNVSNNPPLTAEPITRSDKEMIRSRLIDAGAVAVGFAKAEEVDQDTDHTFRQWLRRGENAGMEYMHNYPELRKDPRLLLDGCRTVISLAFSFAQPVLRSPEAGYIAQYAYGRDYHKELRKTLRPIIKTLFEEKYGSLCRICIDSAPIMERFWAQKAGIGYIGDNGTLIIPGVGSMVFLAEILTTLDIAPDQPLKMDCGHCGECRRNCPGHAINPDNTVDCRQCLSYLTIEHKGSFPSHVSTDTSKQSVGFQRQPTKVGNPPVIFGCDRCLTVCPHNRLKSPKPLPALLPSETMLTITSEEFLKMSEESFRELLPSSPLLRAGLDGIRRNILDLQL